MSEQRTRIVIMGAAGRDFHNFNVFFRQNRLYEVVAFTATQIPDIEGRMYPPELSGPLYPDGIPILAEEDLAELVGKHRIDQAVFAYSDVPHTYVMGRASWVMSLGPDFVFLGPARTMLKSTKPVIAVCAVRTGAGKSPTTRRVTEIIRDVGLQAAVIRHPMPYGDLTKQIVQRFATYEDLDRYECTIEEREEYEPHIDRSTLVFAGVDYERILRAAEEEADVVVWDGGNNDMPFYRPDLFITIVDPHRPGHETLYHPGETNLRMADCVVVNKIDTAAPEGVQQVRDSIARVNPRAVVVDAAAPIFIDEPERIRGRRVLVIEDGPTLTHGEMKYGAGVIVARRYGAAELIDPRPYAVGSIKATFNRYRHIGPLLPAMGYSGRQIKELAETINAAPADLVLIATPIDLRRLM
ncbi:MAG: cyclic 2,3-diphosphoglycerate synthase, partial [Bacillota bacterium]|nr:cyclic 2,3-diphosphoglycerate synthase [Bacillota bacterium]